MSAGVPFFAPSSRQRTAAFMSRGTILPSAYAHPRNVCAGANPLSAAALTYSSASAGFFPTPPCPEAYNTPRASCDWASPESAFARILPMSGPSAKAAADIADMARTRVVIFFIAELAFGFSVRRAARSCLGTATFRFRRRAVATGLRKAPARGLRADKIPRPCRGLRR